MDNQNNKDDFGILPWDFTPSLFLRLLGCPSVCIKEDLIAFSSNKVSSKEINYSDIKSVDYVPNKVLITANEEIVSLKFYALSQKVCRLLNRLVCEKKEYDSFVNSTEISVSAGFECFEKTLGFRANPYVWATNIILLAATKNDFSDLHFEPYNDSIKLSYRIFGTLNQLGSISKNSYEHLLARVKYLFNCNSQVTNKAQEGAYRFNNREIRLATFPTDCGERASFRFINSIKYTSVSSLNWGKELSEKWLNLIKSKTGLFLITGAVGSGKTTAMYATLAELVNDKKGCLRAVTIEDPVEAKIDGICQSTLDTRTEESLGSAFKHLLRQDPDVIAIGEIRDAECIAEALQAGLSGHLVLATFHAGSVEETIDRIKMMSAGNELILSGLKGILHLKLDYNGGTVSQFPIIKEM